jgi:hypothetical protein
LPGVLAESQQRDPKFVIRSVKGVRPMTLPDEPKLAPTAVVGAAKQGRHFPAATMNGARNQQVLAGVAQRRRP